MEADDNDDDAFEEACRVLPVGINLYDDVNVVLDTPYIEPNDFIIIDGVTEVENGGNEQNADDVNMDEANTPSLASITGTGSGDNDDEAPYHIDAKDFPDNGVELGGRRSKNPPGLTGPYKKLRKEHFGNTSKTKAARTVSNEWIDENILAVLQERFGFQLICFFVKRKDGTYRELSDEDEEKYITIKTDIWNMKSNSQVAKVNIVQSSAPPIAIRLSESVTAKRSLLRTMQDDPVKIKLYEGILDGISAAAIEGKLNGEKILEEMYTWMEETWIRFFENDKKKKRQNVSTSENSNSSNDPDSSGNGKSDSSTKFKKPKGNPKNGNDYESEPPSDDNGNATDTSGHACKRANQGFSDEEYDDSSGLDASSMTKDSDHSDSDDDDDNDCDHGNIGNCLSRLHKLELNARIESTPSPPTIWSLQSADQPQSPMTNSDATSVGTDAVVAISDSEKVSSVVIEAKNIDSTGAFIHKSFSTTMPFRNRKKKSF